jgi:hypothetical protein
LPIDTLDPGLWVCLKPTTDIHRAFPNRRSRPVAVVRSSRPDRETRRPPFGRRVQRKLLQIGPEWAIFLAKNKSPRRPAWTARSTHVGSDPDD